MVKDSGETGSSAMSDSDEQRRGFFKRVLAIVIGAIVCLVPGVTSLVVFFDPLRKRGAAADFISVAPLDAVPADGLPRRFQVIADRTDAWNRFVDEPLGAVYLVRSAEKPEEVVAFNALCPHLGCFVSYQASRDGFFCPCHHSSFQTDGEIIEPSPAERPLDRLETKIETISGEEDSQAAKRRILVKFQNFRAGGTGKVPK